MTFTLTLADGTDRAVHRDRQAVRRAPGELRPGHGRARLAACRRRAPRRDVPAVPGAPAAPARRRGGGGRRRPLSSRTGPATPAAAAAPSDPGTATVPFHGPRQAGVSQDPPGARRVRRVHPAARHRPAGAGPDAAPAHRRRRPGSPRAAPRWATPTRAGGAARPADRHVRLRPGAVSAPPGSTTGARSRRPARLHDRPARTALVRRGPAAADLRRRPAHRHPRPADADQGRPPVRRGPLGPAGLPAQPAACRPRTRPSATSSGQLDGTANPRGTPEFDPAVWVTGRRLPTTTWCCAASAPRSENWDLLAVDRQGERRRPPPRHRRTADRRGRARRAGLRRPDASGLPSSPDFAHITRAHVTDPA